MKKILMVLALFISAHLIAQKPMFAEGNLPTGSWTFLAAANADSFISENDAQGKPYRKSVINFVSENKYEFMLDEYDAAGAKITQVKETGTYTSTTTQFTLKPYNSETIVNPSSRKNLNTVATKATGNSLAPAVYNWQVEKNKTGTQASLIMTAVQPGFREGIFSIAVKSYRQLPPAKQKSIARAL